MKLSFLTVESNPFVDNIYTEITTSCRNELPNVCSYYYWNVFATKEYLTFDDNFLTTLYWFLCQTGSTVLISSDPTKLITFGEILRTIIFPFEYDDSYMPLISESNYGYLSAPFPLVIGVVVTSEEELLEVENLTSIKSLLVNLDKDDLKVKLDHESLVSIKQFRKEYDFEQLKQYSWKNFPAKPLKELKKAMKKTIKVIQKVEEKKQANELMKAAHIEVIRDHFLKFFMMMFKNYEKYVDQKEIVEYDPNNFIERFNMEKFLKNESDKYDFFRDLFHTRAWILFLENKIYASTVEAESQIEYFDARIELEYSKKKKFSEFLIKTDSLPNVKPQADISEKFSSFE